MFKIGIFQKIHQDGINLLNNNSKFNYEIIDDLSKENLLRKIPEYDGITLRTTKIDNDILGAGKKLKVISRHGVGYDNVDTAYLKQNNISLLITATANAYAVAEHVFYMMLSISKNYLNLDKETRLGHFKKNFDTFPTFELFNKEILIAGFGRIGKNLIKKCNGFDMKVKVYDPFVNEKEINAFGGTKVNDFSSAIKTADFVSIHMPLNAQTKNLINYQLIKTMKKSSVIINTARGGIVNETDLDKALNENLITGAGLDVFEKEPVDTSNPLLKNNKVIMSPHTAALTNECKIRMAKETVQNIIDFFENKIDKSMIVKI
jgi:D-3-phosphoglycerate dehydrogenase